MATVTPVEAEPVVTQPAGRAIPPRVAEAISSAGFPPELGDPASLFRYTRLDTQSPTVSHLLVNGGLSAYNRFGQSIQRATVAMNRAENPQWSMNTIRGEFLFLDPQALANAPAPVRAATMAALERLTQQLGGEAAPTPATDADTVERRTTPRDTTTTGPRPQQVDLPTPGTSRTTPLPRHAALEGITDDYRAWLTRGDNRMRTVEALLGERPESFEAGLTSVQQRYGLGTDGRPRNIQEAAQRLQTELGVPGTPDGKFGRVSTPYLTAARERYSAQAATPEGQEQVRSELAGKDTLQAAISPNLGATPPVTPDPVADPEPVPTETPVVTPPADQVTTEPRPVQGPPVPNTYQSLSAWRTSDPARYTAERDRVISGVRNNPTDMMRIFNEARGTDQQVANDLASAWLDAHAPSALNPDQVVNEARREFARQMGRDPRIAASLPPALNDRFAAVLAPNSPGQGLFVEPSAQNLPALRVFENNRVQRALTSADLLQNDRNRYGTFMWADPAVVAAKITSLAAQNPDIAEDFGTAFAKHLHGVSPESVLDARVAALRPIFQQLQGVPRQRVEEGMRGMGRWSWLLGFNFNGIADFLVDRVVK